ncbi:MAG: acyltransferase [Verrucomicrobiota bacterium]|jgi:acetyltransferase-like isoleucine patch superfamily enzyme
MNPPHIHPQALVDSGAIVGAGTRVWAFAHVCNGAVIGEDCNLCDHTFFEKGVRLGNRVTVKCGVYLWEGTTVEDDVFVGPCVAFTNDLWPRSKKYPEKFAETHLRHGCSIGANATLLPVSIGRWALVAAGSVVTRDVPDFALVRGNPASLAAWLCRCGNKLQFKNRSALCPCGRSFRNINADSIQEKL